MSQAIYYINQNGVKQSSINQNGTTLSDSIPEQAVKIPINGVLDKATLLTSLAKACHFPSYFAHNWDSAWDCLTDSDVSHLQLCLVGVEKINTEDLNVFRSIIEDAYKDFGKPQLWIVVPSEDK